ncbi:hypothetical protein NUSPORA_01307 [Nucleospora cyclopteri]
MNAIREETTLDSIFYALLGFDTASIWMESPSDIKVEGHGRAQIAPFQYLIVKVREFSMMEQFIPFVAAFFRKINDARKRVKTVEELYVALQEDFQIFKNLDRIKNKHILEYIGNDSTEIANEEVELEEDIFYREKIFVELFSGNSKENAVNSYFYNKFMCKLQEELLDWVNTATLGKIVTATSTEGFNKSYWSSTFNFECNFVDQEIAKDILNCGKMVHFARTYSEINIVQEKCPNLLRDNLKKHNMALLRKFNMLLEANLRDDLKILYDVMLCRNCIFYFSIAENFYNQLLGDDQTVFEDIKEILHLKNIKNGLFELNFADSSFNAYILKLLKSSRNPAENSFCSLLEQIHFNFTPKLLKFFLSPKNFAELKILNRFLLNVFFSSFYLEQSSLKYTFSKAMYLIIHKIKEIPINIVKMEYSMDQLVISLKTQIKELLNIYNLTNSVIYENWVLFFQLCHEYIQIEYKENIDEKKYTERLRDILISLNQSICKFGENEISDLLKDILKKLNKSK